jgi:hypothetical protein
MKEPYRSCSTQQPYRWTRNRLDPDQGAYLEDAILIETRGNDQEYEIL